MYRLVFHKQTGPKKPVTVDLPTLVIGSDADCELRLTETGVRSRHAAIECRTGGYYLRDLQDSHDVLVNGQSAGEQRVTAGDELTVGPVRMRFEIVPNTSRPLPQRRAVSLTQVLAAAIVISVIGGQVALLSSLFLESRPRKVKIDTTHSARAEQQTPQAPQPAPTAPEPAIPPQPVETRPPEEPVVLNRMIRLTRVDRTDSTTGVTATIVAKAQVGERELDRSAVAMCVQFAVLNNSSASVVWRDPVWLTIPEWENFKSKSFTASFPGAPSNLMGFVVRTYYRKTLQDVAAVPATLRALAPNAFRGGAS